MAYGCTVARLRPPFGAQTPYSIQNETKDRQSLNETFIVVLGSPIQVAGIEAEQGFARALAGAGGAALLVMLSKQTFVIRTHG